jgi:dTDP-4-amino-4,6-dideoxygalactose transaminase
MINVTQTFLPPLEEYTAYLEKIWESKWLTNRGELVQKLEERLREYLCVENLLAVNNGTIALQIAIKAYGLAGEIITTPFSYVATASSIVWENCSPVFVDIDPRFLTIDESNIDAAITNKTSAILATHVYGNPCDVEAIEEIALRNNLRVIYDAAHCFGVRYKGESVLTWGDISTLSFHATKLFHTGEGGAIVCNDAELADVVFNYHNFGHRGAEHFWGLGINGKMSEISAAMGLAVLPYIDKILDRRKCACDHYDSLLENVNLERLELRAGTEWNYSYYPVIFPSEGALLRVKSAMHNQAIYPRRYFFPSLNTLPYVTRREMKIAEDVSRRVLCLPMSAGLSESEITTICEIINENG